MRLGGVRQRERGLRITTVCALPTRRPTRSHLPGLGEISRARHIVARLGGRFSLELGIETERSADDIERWALAATLIGGPSPLSVALHTYRVLGHAGLRTFDDVRACDRKRLVRLLDEGGYVRYDESAASRLLALAEAVADRYPGGLAELGERFVGPRELEGELGALPGWDPASVRTFLRELQGVFPGADAALDPRASLAARHVALPPGRHGLTALAAAAHLDLRDLEAALTRLALEHDSFRCPGGEECPVAEADPEQFVHF